MNSIKKNLFYNVFYQFLSLILPMITAPYISRILGVEALGTYSYSYSVASYFLLFAMLGISNHGNRSIAACRDDKGKMSQTFSNIYIIQFINSILIIFIYTIYSVIFSENNQIALIQEIIVISALFDISWFYFGIEQFKVTVMRNTICKILTVVAVFIFVKKPEDLFIYAFIMATSVLVSQILLWSFLKKYINLSKPTFINLKKDIKEIMVLFLPVLAYSFYRIMSKIMLGNMSNMTEVGYFENADKIIVMPMGIITALGTVMLPRISNLISKGQHKLQKLYIENSFQFVTITASALCFGLAGISNIFAPIFFGDEFIKSGNLIALLSITILFASWASVIRTQYLIPNKLDKIYVLSMSIGAISNILINLVLIPKFKSYGASIGTISAEFLVMFVQFWCVRRDLNIKIYIKRNSIYLLFGFIMFLLVRLIGYHMSQNIITLIIIIAFGAIIYIGLVLVHLLYKKR
ncbi:MAG: flippase [Clostridium sp.]|nr:flippase [Clostridium sp.]